MTKDDVKQFPIQAGATLCGMYGLIKFFGKEIINPIILAFLGFSAGEIIKDILSTLSGGSLDKYKEKKLFHLKNETIGLDIEIT